MSEVVRASHLSKIYKVYFGPRALLREILFGKSAHHSIPALQDVSFSVSSGESFGIVGDNGAGKSTLLKILTGTAVPTSGEVNIQGKVSALLELGAGFHPEFSGLENIQFNGALMGLSRSEIEARKKEIIAFSELEEFIDNPVKTYSSGMYLRLGFAVATGFDPSVLIIDEALAVGDQRFQKKCTDRILDFKRRGKTILFCSHNLYQVRTLCDRAIWLQRGAVASSGQASRVTDQYTDYLRMDRNDSASNGLHVNACEEGDAKGAPPEKKLCWIEKSVLLDESGSSRNLFQAGESFVLEVWAHFDPAFQGTPGIGVSVIRNDEVVIYTTSNTMEGIALKLLEPGRYFARIRFPHPSLLSGSYYFNLSATDQNYLQSYDAVLKAQPFTIQHPGPDFGLVRLQHEWEHN